MFHSLLRFVLRFRVPIFTLIILTIFEIIYHVNSLRVVPSVSDPPFNAQCNEPDTNAPRENAAIVMLARNSDVDGAAASIKSLERHFNRWFQYPIIFLNDEPFDTAFISTLSRATSGEVFFEVINGTDMWGYPPWIAQDTARTSMANMEAHGVRYAGIESYHHMCRFNSGRFYDHPALAPYRWYWRVEPDVKFTCSITYDPFLAMARSRKRYGYTIALWELGQSVPSLFAAIGAYKRAHALPSGALWASMIDASWAPWFVRPLLGRWLSYRDRGGDVWNLCHFWSNFEIADMHFFRSAPYRALFDELDAAGGFYYERWGDAPVHSLAAALLLKPEEVHYFADFGYRHEPFQHCPANALGGQMVGSASFPAESATWAAERLGGVGCRCECDPDEVTHQDVCLNRLRESVFKELPP